MIIERDIKKKKQKKVGKNHPVGRERHQGSAPTKSEEIRQRA